MRSPLRDLNLNESAGYYTINPFSIIIDCVLGQCLKKYTYYEIHEKFTYK